jgi:hypothetical protein
MPPSSLLAFVDALVERGDELSGAVEDGVDKVGALSRRL